MFISVIRNHGLCKLFKLVLVLIKPPAGGIILSCINFGHKYNSNYERLQCKTSDRLGRHGLLLLSSRSTS